MYWFFKKNHFWSTGSFVRNVEIALMGTSLGFITEQKLKNVVDLWAWDDQLYVNLKKAIDSLLASILLS